MENLFAKKIQQSFIDNGEKKKKKKSGKGKHSEELVT